MDHIDSIPEGWRRKETPRWKKDWLYCELLLLDTLRERNGREEILSPVFTTGRIVWLIGRTNAGRTLNTSRDVSWMGNEYVLDVTADCPLCGDVHRAYIPESWIAEGRAVFVEKQPETAGAAS